MVTNCPACGFDLEFSPWDEGSPSDEICPSCGIQFGYDDAAGGDESARARIYADWRRRWIEGGMKWWSKSARPEGWDPKKQLRDAGLA